MAQYDIHRLRSGELVVDCQTDFLDILQTRVVVPLVDPEAVPAPLPRLHPLFGIDGGRFLFAAHLMAAIPAHELGSAIGSLACEDLTIGNALDFLLTGI
jgi:toxin CcdB